MSYSATYYEAKVRRVWHLDHLRAVCTLLGAPWPNSPKRVLSVGCGTGVHLIPLACQYPETTFVGCDPEEEPLSRGLSFQQSVGVTNLSFVAGTAAEVTGEPFDLTVVQGVYSWIHREQQDQLIGACAERLAPDGVMLLTHNVAPGWTIRQVIQQYLATVGISPSHSLSGDDLQRAQDALAVFRDDINQDSAFGALMSAEIKRILGESTAYLRHEFLNPATSGEALSAIVERLTSHGFFYLGDARYSRNPLEDHRNNRVISSTARDFQRGIPYRESLFTRRAPDERFSPPTEASLSLLSYGTILTEDEQCPGDFRDPAGREFTFNTDHLSCLLLNTLSRAWPRFIPWRELCETVRAPEHTVVPSILDLLASELITIAKEPPHYTSSSSTVTAPPWLGWELSNSSQLTNRLYEPVGLGGFEEMLLTTIVGGLTSVEGLIRLTATQISRSPEHRTLPPGVIADTVREGLRTLARAGLLHEIVED